MRDSYYTISEKCSCEIKIEKSRFIANIFHLDANDEVNTYLLNIRKKYHDAKHHPYGFRRGLDKNNFRYNDDGEPSGSSGKPILDAIDKYDLTDILIIVTRYFGGVKLGIGGLQRAYFNSAEECIKKSKITEQFLCEKYEISFDYAFINPVINYLKKNKIKIIANESVTKVKLLCELRLSLSHKFVENINNLTNGKVNIIKNQE